MLLSLVAAAALAAATDTSLRTGPGKAAPAPDAVRATLSTTAIQLDGELTEPVWQTAAPATLFTQRDPREGAPASQRTEVRVAFDEAAIYIGARLYDTAPDSVRALLARRDVAVSSDAFKVYLDPYHDGRTGFYFGVNAAGTLYDGTLYNDDWDDNSWDGVWEAATRRTADGWSVEMRIPLSQLRFTQRPGATWGINFKREIARLNESDYLVYTPSNGSGFVSRFVPLSGLEGVKPPPRLEVRPYVTGRAEFTPTAAGDPLNSGSRVAPSGGADMKMGLGGNLTLDGAVNPDFGQVEVDPAIVNLSDVESYFDERRPFFVEGSQTFTFGEGGANDYWGFNWTSANQLFYSRRIGRAPQGDLPDAAFHDAPTGTHILGAAKLTGKVRGWRIGTVSALTRREHARLSDGATRWETEIEPSTYYNVSRAQKEIAGGQQGLGVIGTYTHRFFSGDGVALRDQINSSALTGGVDGWTFLDSDRKWVVTGWVAGSAVHGSPTRLVNLQRSSAHYFQRPDANYVGVDSSATALTGYAGRVTLNKQKGNSFVNAAFAVIDPGYDVNDLGFNFRTDMINMHVVGGYRWMQPNAWRRNVKLFGSLFRTYDFGGNPTWMGYWQNTRIQWNNYWQTRLSLAYNPTSVSTRRTRGGPLTLNPRGVEVDFGGDSDDRKSVVYGFDSYLTRYAQGSDRSWSLNTYVQWKPAQKVSLKLSPSIDRTVVNAQYVGTFADPTAAATFGNRYVFADLRQTTLSASVRVNWIFTPRLSLEVYAQPLVSSGAYTTFKELAAPRSYSFSRYGDGASTFDPATHLADPDGPAGPAPALDVGRPDFTFASLRGNAVLRWEYLPGSTLFVVWTQNRHDDEEIGTFRAGHSLGRIFSAKAENIFLVKLSYWWNP